MASKNQIKNSLIFSAVVVASVTINNLFALKENYVYEAYQALMPEILQIEDEPDEDSTKVDTKYPLKSDKHPLADAPDTANSFDLNDPPNISKEIEYDPESKEYIISERLNDEPLGPVNTLSEEKFREEQFKKDEERYYQQRLQMLGLAKNNTPSIPPMSREGLFDRLFGNNKINIEPSGNIEMTAGGFYQKRDNPNLLEQNREFFQPDFGLKMNINLVAQIGDKLKLNISNNTVPSLNNQNLQNIEFTGKEDDIIKKIEIGNVNFPLKSSLVTGVQSLMGVKSQLQFGRMWITSVASIQKSIRKSVTVDAGGQTQYFELKADQYEENKNFLLGQYFFNNYNKSLENYPVINSQVIINKVEVWITNRTGQTEGVRDILSFMDLGESTPYNTTLTGGTTGTSLPDNNSNGLYSLLQSDPRTRVQATATSAVSSMGLTEGVEFQRVTMRKLPESEYTFQPQLGYLALTTIVNPDDVLAVSYRFTYNGKVYQVGEFSDELPPDTANQKIVFSKLLKGISNRPHLPIWNLMMKNVYSIGYGSIGKENFKLDVYYQDPGGGEKRYLPEGANKGVPIIKLLNLDRLNVQNDPIQDGVFDFVEGITIIPNQGKIIFPVLEPFGDDLKPALGADPALERKYLYNTLYDSTKIVAQQKQQNNRFLIKGQYRSSFSDDIYLGSFSLAEGSVTVTAGGSVLQEGIDYQVDYGSGRLRILNQGIKNSGLQLNVQYEDNAAFGMNQQTFFGNRIDYFLNDKVQFGATYMRLSERPVGYKTRLNEDPVSNSVVAADATYQSELKDLTKLLDKLPFYSTNAPSFISTSIEGAALLPGHHKASNVSGDEGGTQYLDDFEGTSGYTDLKFQAFNWTLASTPLNARDESGNILFPEANISNDIRVGNNRANLSWYTIDNNFTGTDAPSSVKNDFSRMNYWRQVTQNEVYRNKTIVGGQNYLATLDLSYYPRERGPYNFDINNIDPTSGYFTNPRNRWAGIQRSIDNMNSDFETSNVEYITFWVMDPFIDNPTSTGGDLYINLGNVSEDVLKDGRLSFENGLDIPKDLSKLDVTPFGYVPKFQQQVSRSFFNDEDSRDIQDVGYDLLNDDEEKEFFRDFINQLSGILPAGHPELERLKNDPANDNYRHFRNAIYDDNNTGAIDRYRFFNRPHGNTPILDNSNQTPGTGLPDSEDINRDNSLNESEAYFNYRIKMRPNMNVGENHIVDKHTVDVKLKDGSNSSVTWYQFKVPKEAYDEAVGGISDFRSIRFIRMFLTGFEDSVVLRFAQLQLERNNWRRYQYSLLNPGENIPEPDLESTSFSVTNVGIEQNSNKSPVPYKMPPGIQRLQQPISTGQTIEQDEQSLALTVCGLKDGDSRGVFKAFNNMDLRQYKYLKMFIHAENIPNQTPLRDGEVVAFIRIGSDFTHNYYEYQIPLKITPDGANSEDLIWPSENRLNLDLEKLVEIKNARNEAGLPSHVPYTAIDGVGYKMTVVGNPNLAESRNVMVGVHNPKKTLATPDDDGERKCVEVWFNEMRVTGMNEEVGYAASANVNVKLADLGTVNLSGSMHTAGYGNINQKLNERFRDNFYQLGGNTNLELGKLMPNTWGVTMPIFFAYNQNVSNPIYDPYDKDVFMSEKLKSSTDVSKTKRDAQDFTSITSFNVSNFQILGNPERSVNRIMPWSMKNVSMNYSFNKIHKHNPLIEIDDYVDQRLGLQYSYSTTAKYIEPFKKLFNERSPYWNIIKDINFNYLPSNITFKNDLRKIFSETQIRNVDNDPYQIDPLFFKNFTWERFYNFNWNLTKSIAVSYTGTNRSRIDEPYGRITTEMQRDSLWNSVMNLGRNTYYTHDVNATYNLPTSKIPILDWMRINGSYNTTYIWSAASLVARQQGNFLTNTSSKTINASLNFSQLYNKSRHLRVLSSRVTNNRAPAPGKNNNTINPNESTNNKINSRPNTSQQIPKKPEKVKVTKEMIPGFDTLSSSELKKQIRIKQKAENLKYRKELRNWRKKKNSIVPYLSPEQRAIGNLLTMVKTVNVNFTENAGTVLPGYMDSTDVLGFNMSNWAPGLFAIGYQPSKEWIEQQAGLGRMSTDSIFNNQFMQSYGKNINISANLEPVPDLKIDLKYNSSFRKNYSETFKYDWSENQFKHMNPYDMGSFNISYIGIKTMFDKLSSDKMTDAFADMLEFRKTISHRLGRMNPYTNGLPDPSDPEYAKGYGRFSQDVLIPAFIAAYTGKDPNNAALISYDNNNVKNNPFKHFKALPNWTINYTGLNKIGNLSESIKTFRITHAYSGSVSMNSFNSSLLYRDFIGVGFPSFIDSNSGNYIPYFLIPNITISESFMPFIEVELVLQNSFQIKAKYNKSRVLSLSLVDYQVSETQSSEIGLGGGYRFKGVNLPFRVFGLDRLENDLNFKFTVMYKNDLTVNAHMANNKITPVRGQKLITINPTLDYIINDNFQVTLFYERTQTIPAVLLSYPLTSTRAGLTIRYILSEGFGF